MSRYPSIPAHKLVQSEAAVALDGRGELRVAIVSDTHSQLHPQAIERLTQLAPSTILHAGDIGELSVLDELAQVAPVIAVRGNIDARAPHVRGRDARANTLPDVVAIDVRAGADSALKLLLLHIAVYGPKLRADAARLAAASGARVVICGHSHVPFLGRDRGLTVFNPGSVGPRRMHLPIVFGMLQVAAGKLSLQHIDCETGAPWNP